MTNALDLDEVIWENGYAPGYVFGECVHKCDHSEVKLTAVGPDNRRHQLMVCTSADCSKADVLQCRAWFTKRGIKWGPWRTVHVDGT